MIHLKHLAPKPELILKPLTWLMPLLLLSACSGPPGGGTALRGVPKLNNFKASPALKKTSSTPELAKAAAQKKDTPEPKPAEASSAKTLSKSEKTDEIAVKPPNADKPGKDKRDNFLGILLADDVLSSGNNPFYDPFELQESASNGQSLSKSNPSLFGTEVSASAKKEVTQAAVPNPLNAIQLKGIIYNPTAAMAVITQEGGSKDRQLVHVGDFLESPTGRIQVQKISPDSIHLVEVGKPENQRKLVINSLLQSQSKTNSASGSSASGKSASSADLTTLLNRLGKIQTGEVSNDATQAIKNIPGL